jgi:drug/metabolite transporter (DMT)-like permease
MQADDRSALAAAALGMTAVGVGVAVSARLTAYPVATAQALRYAAAAAILSALARRGGRREAPPAARDRARIWLVAATGMALFNIAVVRAVTTGEPASVATIVGCAPIVFAIAVPLLERRRPALPVVAGACLVAAGAAVVEGVGAADAASIAWSVVALACEVAFTVVAAPVLRTTSPLELSRRACWVAAGMLALAAPALEGTGALRLPDGGELAAIAYLAVAATVGAFVLWYGAVRRLGAEKVGLLCGLMPVAAAFAGVLVAGEPFRWRTLAGTDLVAVGLLLALTTRPARVRVRQRG